MCCLFAHIPAITMVAGKSRHIYFSPKTHYVTISTKQNLKNTFKTPINQFINVRNPKKWS
jgi:flagellar biosynthesis regulator FlbT